MTTNAVLEALRNPDQPIEWYAGRGGLRSVASIRERLFEDVDTSDSSACWLSPAEPSQARPGIWIAGKRVTRYRAVFIIFNGREPLGGQVRHTCDVPRCINPGHLLEGTAKDNTQDMMSRGRQRPGGRRKQ